MQPVHMDGYETVGDLAQLQAFYQAHAPAYARWVASFERGLYQDGMLQAMDDFYRLQRDKPVVFTLGALNCGFYAMPDLRGVSPNLPNQSTILVAYGQVVQHHPSLAKPPPSTRPPNPPKSPGTSSRCCWPS